MKHQVLQPCVRRIHRLPADYLWQREHNAKSVSMSSWDWSRVTLYTALPASTQPCTTHLSCSHPCGSVVCCGVVCRSDGYTRLCRGSPGLLATCENQNDKLHLWNVRKEYIHGLCLVFSGVYDWSIYPHLSAPRQYNVLMNISMLIKCCSKA